MRVLDWDLRHDGKMKKEEEKVKKSALVGGFELKVLMKSSSRLHCERKLRSESLADASIGHESDPMNKACGRDRTWKG